MLVPYFKQAFCQAWILDEEQFRPLIYPSPTSDHIRPLIAFSLLFSSCLQHLGLNPAPASSNISKKD